MQHDAGMRAAARVIYETVYEDTSPVGFDEAERLRTAHYRHAVDAAQRVRVELQADDAEQIALF